MMTVGGKTGEISPSQCPTSTVTWKEKVKEGCTRIELMVKDMAKKTILAKLQIWIDARKKYHLTHIQVQMARELGLNPKKFGGYANHRQEKWKRPLGEYIEELYFKRFKKERPSQVIALEESGQKRNNE